MRAEKNDLDGWIARLKLLSEKRVNGGLNELIKSIERSESSSIWRSGIKSCTVRGIKNKWLTWLE